MEQEIPEMNSLLILVEHQHQHNYQVRYEFMIISGDDQHLTFIHALKEKGPDVEIAKALVTDLERSYLKIWSDRGYIQIIEGGIANGHGYFWLLPKAIGLIRA